MREMDKRGGIKYTLLHSRYGGDPGNDPEKIALQTKAYLMMVVSSVLFPTSSRNVVYPSYIAPFYTWIVFAHFFGVLLFWRTYTRALSMHQGREPTVPVVVC